MARTAKSTSANHTAEPSEGADAPAKGPDLGMNLEGARFMMSHSLASLQGLVDSMAQLERLQSKSFAAWSQALGAAMQEAEQAEDLQSIWSVQVKLANKQLAMGMQQFADSLSQWMEGENSLSNQIREQSAALAQRILPQVAAPASGGNGMDHPALAQLGQWQQQWLANTQRWIDTARSAAPR